MRAHALGKRCRMKNLSMTALAAMALLTIVSCRQDAASPTEPGAQPALTSTTPTTVPFYQISTGRGPPCAVTPDNRAYCWTNGADAAAVPVPGGKLFRS